MTGLNSFVRTMTGPARLRSALRQKTAPIQALLTALDGPTELQVSIPASVFGGDIFGVMSEHLREALVVAPPAAPTALRTLRKQSRPSITDPFAPHPSNPFPSIVDWLKQSTLPSTPLDKVSSTVLPSVSSEQTTSLPSLSNSLLGSQASHLSSIAEGLLRQRAGETPARRGLKTTELMASSSAKSAPAAPALVNSLKCYWESIRETRDAARANLTSVSTESLGNARDIAVSDLDRHATSHAWPAFPGRDAATPRAFGDDTNRPAHLPLRPARVNSLTHPQLQNDFNFRVNPADHHASHYDDLGERLAEILHEQALQHGIDVT